MNGRVANVPPRSAWRDPGPAGAHHDQRQGYALAGGPNGQFRADRPNRLWMDDFTYSTWQGFVYVTLVIDFQARRVGDWKVRAYGLRARCAGAGTA